MEWTRQVASAAAATCLAVFAIGVLPARAGGFPTSFLPGDFPTNQFDDRRTGWNPNEVSLNTQNVNSNSFGVIWTAPLDSRSFTQPIVAMQEFVAGGTHNVVFVGTMNDTLYAFDVDSGALLWRTTFENAGANITAVPDSFYGFCQTFAPSLGITQTPVYDRSTHTLYVVAATLEGTSGHQHMHFRLHRLSVISGADVQTPVEINGSVPTNTGGTLTFDPDVQADRPALLDSNGNIYVGFGAFDGFYPTQAHGWVFAYNATTLAQVGVFSTTRGNLQDDTYLGALWGGGTGIAADDTGNVFFATGDGALDGAFDFGDSLVRLPPNLGSSQLQFFAPSDATLLLQKDLDLGSGAPVLFPAQSTGLYRDLVWVEGKNDVGFLMNADQLHGITGGSNTHTYLRATDTRPIFGSGATFQDQNGALYYYTNDNSNPSHLAQYTIGTGNTDSAYTVTRTATSSVPFTRISGATPEISSNGTSPGTAIVWYLDRPLTRTTGTVTLYAYDARTLNTPLFSGVAGQWTIAASGALIEPTITDGKVFVATDNRFTVFGLIGAARTRGIVK